MFVYSVTRHLVVIVINLCQRGLNLSKKLIVTSQADFYSRRHFQLMLLLYSESVTHFSTTHSLVTHAHKHSHVVLEKTHLQIWAAAWISGIQTRRMKLKPIGDVAVQPGQLLACKVWKALTLLAKTLTQRAKTRYFFFCSRLLCDEADKSLLSLSFTKIRLNESTQKKNVHSAAGEHSTHTHYSGGLRRWSCREEPCTHTHRDLPSFIRRTN